MEVDATDGRIYLPKELREKYGDQFRLVERGDQLVLLPVADDPLGALRDEFADVDKSVRELREDARASAIEDAGE
jgi:bifunctional DNA-binding transcriptional regulator/antitoxin component of YhaV-PrlF toxin-antitoxin module